MGWNGTNARIEYENIPPLYRVLILADEDIEFPTIQTEDKDIGWRVGLDGPITFHTAIAAASSLSETLTETERLDKWMFDSDFRQSRKHFTAIQVLRIFKECIGTVSQDSQRLDALFCRPPTGFPRFDFVKEDYEVLKSNWEWTFKRHKNAEERLLRRVSAKTEEVKSLLQDAILNATAVSESHNTNQQTLFSAKEALSAQEGADSTAAQSEILFIFTVVTIVFLPLSFFPTWFSMWEINGKPEARWSHVQVLIGAISGPIIGLLVLGAAFWFVFRKRRAEYKRLEELVKWERLHSLPSNLIDEDSKAYRIMNKIRSANKVKEAMAAAEKKGV